MKPLGWFPIRPFAALAELVRTLGGRRRRTVQRSPARSLPAHVAPPSVARPIPELEGIKPDSLRVAQRSPAVCTPATCEATARPPASGGLQVAGPGDSGDSGRDPRELFIPSGYHLTNVLGQPSILVVCECGQRGPGHTAVVCGRRVFGLIPGRPACRSLVAMLFAVGCNAPETEVRRARN